MSKRSRVGKGKAIVALLTTMVVALSLCGCKPTDFFTEIIITPLSDVVDEDNPDATIVNNPDAKQESPSLAALKFTDTSSRSEDVQNLVVWSNEPNTDMTTHHSIFDLTPLFPGIAASDGVRLVYDATAVVDHETQTQTQQQSATDAESTSSTEGFDSTTASKASDTSTITDDKQSGSGSDDESGTGDGGDDSGGDSAGKKDGDDQSDDPDDKGKTDDDTGTGGEVKTYRSGNKKDTPPSVHSIAAIGKQAAVLVQSIGGENAVCALSNDAWSGVDPNTGSSFVTVFGDECSTDGLYVFSNDGSTAGDINVASLINACNARNAGDDANLVVYDESVVSDPNKLFTDDEIKQLNAANVVFAPVDFSTVKGMTDAATMVGEALESATDGASYTRSEYYEDAIASIESATQGSKADSSSTEVATLIATDAATGLILCDQSRVNTREIALYGDYGLSDSKPLSRWIADANVNDVLDSWYTASQKGVALLWPVDGVSITNYGSSSGGQTLRARVSGVSSTMQISYREGEGATNASGGLGSKNFPYLIVTGSQDGVTLSVSTVKNLVVSSIKSSGTTPTTYSALSGASATGTRSYIGWTNDRTTTNPFLTGLSANDVVKENPTGLLGAWTEASFEDPLEAVWLTSLYAADAPSGLESGYTPVNDASKLTVSIAGNEYTGCEAIVKAFYSTFYRYDVNYDSVVTDKGKE